MKKKILLGGVIALALGGGILFAADHIDAPAVTGTGSVSLGTDITDVYAFQSPADNTKMVFVINTQGLLSPTASAAAQFPGNTMYELNIDNNGDNVEDMVIQCMVKNGKVRAYGPVAPAATGTTSTVVASAPYAEAGVTGYTATSPVSGTGSNGVKVFAGPRDDPFFFDLKRYKEVIAGTATAFHAGTAEDPATDAFAGTNVMSIVVEVPKTLLGSATSINVWAESKSK
ncbi:MAG: DUF4331 family protein [Bacteroidota bacterium]